MKNISNTLQTLIDLLNDGEFHSGTALGERLGISRTAIWKYTNQLSQYGIEIESVQNKGHRFKAPLILLKEAEIRKNLDCPAHLDLTVLPSISSTNDYLKNSPTTASPSFCITEYQTLGRGRFGRTWHAPFASNIMLSCRWPIKQDVSRLGGLSLCVSLAVTAALTEFGLEDLAIKWPNDVLYRGQKLGGILIEIQAETHGLSQAVIGIGLNVNMPASSNVPIDQAWVSLQSILDQPQDRNQIAALLIAKLHLYLGRFSQKGFAAFRAEWQKQDYLAGKEVSLRFGTETLQGTAKGVDLTGHLLIESLSGQMQTYSAGEVSVRLAKAL